jgi:hypothetical protein
MTIIEVGSSGREETGLTRTYVEDESLALNRNQVQVEVLCRVEQLFSGAFKPAQRSGL